MNSWQEKAHQIIAAEGAAAFHHANILPNGRRRKRHVAYSIPEIAVAIIKALDRNDEVECKRLFLIYETGALSLI